MRKFYIVLLLFMAFMLGGCKTETVYEIFVEQDDIQILLGETYRLEPVVTPADSGAVLVFSSSENEIITVDGEGLVFAAATGRAYVTIGIKDHDIEEIVYIEVYEDIVEEKRFEIIGNTAINVGMPFTLIARYNGVETPVEWEVRGENVLHLGAGVFLALEVGTAIIEAAMPGADGVSATVEVEVSLDKAVITLMPHDDIWVGKNGHYLTAKKSSGIIIKRGDCLYEVADPSVATIDEEGNITALGPGETIVTVRSAEAEGTYLLTIKEIPKENLRNAIIAIAIGEEGYHEGPNNDTIYGAWYGLNYNAWCAMFVSWCAHEAGIDSSVILKYASVQIGLDWFRNKGDERYKSYEETVAGSYIPQCGDIIFFKSDGASHTGLVVKTVGDILYTIEGNTSDRVALRWYYYKNNTRITGYGIPDYPPGQDDIYDFDVSTATPGAGTPTT